MKKVYDQEISYDEYERLRFRVEVLLAHHYNEEEIMNEIDAHPAIIQSILYDLTFEFMF